MNTALHSPKIAAAETSIKPMSLADGRTDYFVSIKVGEREVTPHVFREEYKAAYHVALYDWLLNGSGEEPDVLEFGPDDWPARVMPAETSPGDVSDEEKELFAAVTKIDLAGAVKHLRNWAAYKADEHCQEYANLIEAQARLIAWFVKERAIKVDAIKEACRRAVTELDCMYVNGERVPYGGIPADPESSVWREAIKAAEAAIDRLDVKAEAKSQEPEAVMWRVRSFLDQYEVTSVAAIATHWHTCGLDVEPLYTHPTTKPEAPAVSVDAIARIINPPAFNDRYTMPTGRMREQQYARKLAGDVLAYLNKASTLKETL